MRFATVIAFVLMVMTAATVSAQVPFIAVYFDNTYTEALPPPPSSNPCPGVGVPGELTIALLNANVFVTAVEFKVDYPPQITYLADTNTQPVTIGDTNTGISMGWSIPQNGFDPVFICNVIYTWNCDGCAVTDIPIVVVPHPTSGLVGFTDFPDFNQFTGIGLTSLICATIPTEDTTWGKVKSLYGN